MTATLWPPFVSDYTITYTPCVAFAFNTALTATPSLSLSHTLSHSLSSLSSLQVRRRTQAQQQQQQQQHTLQETRPYCTSEPRLSETETPPQRRKLSQRRPQPHGKFATARF